MEPSPVQLNPFNELAIVFDAPIPTATQYIPFHFTSKPIEENIVVPNPIQVLASVEKPIVFVPSPTATHKGFIFGPKENVCVDDIILFILETIFDDLTTTGF